MKVSIRRVYCNECHRLVWGRQQKANGGTRVSCPKCGKVLWVWTGIKWRYGGLTSTSTKG